MHKDILPPNKLTTSERFLHLAFACLAMGAGLMFLGAFLCLPWIVGGVVAYCLYADNRNRRRRPGPISGIHGTAHFASDEEIVAAGLAGRSEGLIMGALPSRSNPGPPPSIVKILRVPKRDVARMRMLMGKYVKCWALSGSPNLIRLPCSDKMAHVACYMPTGAGKTWRVVIPNLFSCDENAVVYDPSGETVRATAEYRRARFGHEIHVIDPFGVCGMRSTDRLNVLDLVSPDDPGCFDYCNHLAHALVVDKPDSHQDPFWHSGTVSATGFLLLAIMLRGGEKFRNLLSLGELLGADRFHELAGALIDNPDMALRRRAQQMHNFNGKTLQSLLACLATEHGWMDSPAFADVMSGSTFSIRNLFRRKMTLYIVIPGNRVIESQPFLRMMITTILYAAFESGPDAQRPAVRLYLDEIATLGKLDLLMTLFTQGRKFGLRSISFFQAVSQVAEITGSPDKVQTFRAQMAGELFKSKDLQTSKEISEWIGNTTVQTVSTSWQQGTNSGWSSSQGTQRSSGQSGGWSESSSTTVSETGVLAIRPEEILQLREREAIFVSAGTPPVKLNILDAADVQQCANTMTGNRYQKVYLRRVRCQAALILLGMVPLTLASFWLISAGAEQWSQQGTGDRQIVRPVRQSTPVRQPKQ